MMVVSDLYLKSKRRGTSIDQDVPMLERFLGPLPYEAVSILCSVRKTICLDYIETRL